jgi:hypothetical protein
VSVFKWQCFVAAISKIVVLISQCYCVVLCNHKPVLFCVALFADW